MRMPSEIIAAEMAKGGEVRKVLDIAAGHGIFGIAMARQNPEAQIYAADWPKVLEVARQNAEQAGVTSRYHIIPGSAFDVQFGSDYDLALITNFLHHFDPPTCTNFLRKVHTALKRGGRAAILEFVPNPDRVTPPTAAAFSLSIRRYSFQEIRRSGEHRYLWQRKTPRVLARGVLQTSPCLAATARARLRPAHE